MRRTTTRAAAVVALACLLAACSGDDEPEPEPGDSPAAEESSPTGSSSPAVSAAVPAEEAWRLDLDVIGQPIAAGDVAIVHSHRGSRLHVNAVDATSGELLWSDEASPGEVVPGIDIVAGVVGPEGDPSVAYFRPNQVGNLFADLVVVNPRTGRVEHRVDGRLFRAHPDPCVDEEDVCLTARTAYDAPVVAHRLRLADGRFVRETGAPDGSRPIGEGGLIELGDRDPELLARVVDGEVAWRLPVRRAFPQGSTTDHGWTFELVDDPAGEGEMYVGSVGGPLERGPDGTIARYDAARRGIAAIDAESGEVRWREAGSAAACPSQISPTVRCRVQGIGTGGPDELRWRGLATMLEGFDLATGETTWSVDLGDSDELVSPTAPAIRAGEDQRVFRSADGPVVVDLESGEAREPVPDEVFLCGRRADFRYAEPFYIDGQPLRERSGGEVFVPCDARGKPTQGAFTAALVEEAAEEVGDSLVMSVRGALVGYAG